MRTTKTLLLSMTLLTGAGCGTDPDNTGAVDPRIPPVPVCAEGGACDDGDSCTVNDRCQAGRCVGSPSATCGLVVQEWGTYTSVQASDGHPLGGVHHVDEALPAWVHSRNWSNRNTYFFEELPEEPLQQLETPVLYFWSATRTDARVTIGFPEGVVGEWYPDATAYAPAIDRCTAIAGGSMAWDVTIDPSIAVSSFAPVSPDNVWAPSRNVASTPVRFANNGGATESEQFIFYRGLGKFAPSVHVVVSNQDQLRINNSSMDEVAAAFLLNVTGTSGQIVSLDVLRAGETRVASPPAPARSLDAYVLQAQTVLHAALVKSGLRDGVARAMVETWTRSWFKNEGLRLLYLAPRGWTDSYLPTTIAPAPTSLVRTLVGRIEIITPHEEASLLLSVRDHARSGAAFDLSVLGRFAEPRLRRALELLVDRNEHNYAQSLVDQAHAQP